MKNHLSKLRAFTRTELLVVVGVTSFLGALLLRAQVSPDATSAAKMRRIHCVSNLKQVGLSFRMWSNDHDDKFPMIVPAAKTGSMESIESGNSAGHFLVMTNELYSPKILTCLADDRKVVTNFSKFTKANLSYFVGLEADEARPEKILSGDRNVTNGLPANNSVLELPPDQAAGWTEKIHAEAGNLGLSDGSVTQVSTPHLRERLVKSKDPRNRIQLP